MRLQKVLTRNATYQKFEVLQTNRNKRFRYGEFLVEGVRNLNGALAYGWEIRAWLYAQGSPLSRWATDMLAAVPDAMHYALAPTLMDALCGKQDGSELLAIIAMRTQAPDPHAFSRTPLLALFDRPSNRGNLGTVLRSCDAMGVEALYITGHAVDLYDPETVVASMGSFFRVPSAHLADQITVDTLIAALRARHAGFQVIGTSAHAKRPIEALDLTRPTLLLLGNETDGLSAHLQSVCDEMTTIPMAASGYASSLNVGCAATVLFYEASRQRREIKQKEFRR